MAGDDCHAIEKKGRARTPQASPRAEALRAIDHVTIQLREAHDQVTAKLPLVSDPLALRLTIATLVYAREQVEAIQEVKKRRRPTSAPAEEESHG